MNGRFLRVVPLAGLLFGLLALVALASRAGHERTRVPGVPAPPSQVLDYGLTVAIALAAAAMLYGLSRLPAPRPRPVTSVWHLFWSILIIAASLAVGLLIARRLHFVQRSVRPEAGLQSSGDGRRGHAAAGGHGHAIGFHWPVALGVVVALAVAFVAVLLLRRRDASSRLAPEPAPEEALREALGESLDDLRSEPDPRRAVIAAYARAERALEGHGLPRRPSEAPLEYLSRVLLELRVRAAAVLELTDLFERAKFSPHRIDESMREDAISALVAVRDDLAGAAA